MVWAPIFKRAAWGLAVSGGLYFGFVTLLINGWLQRQAIYLHNVRLLRWQDPNVPEQFGFLKNQVQPFYLPTPDGERLYGWHILPIGFYMKNQDAILRESGEPTEGLLRLADLIKADPDARLIINFHGNAGTVAQGWRTDTYRSLASGAADKIHTITIDYRGFGYSTGSPTEGGVILDGVTLVKWALSHLEIPPERVLLLGQSLGTAVATAVTEELILKEGIAIKNLMLVAAFSDIPTLMLTYAIAGFVPILSPLRSYPALQRFFASKVQETWYTAARLENVVRRCKEINVYLIHARNDFDIPLGHSDTLFYKAANATTDGAGLATKEIDAVKTHLDLGEGGWVNRWKTGQGADRTRMIQQNVVLYGGHNRILTYPVVAKVVLEAFGL